jgi:integrase
MEKRARGEIRVHERGNRRLTFSIRFRVNAKRVSLTLGTNEDGWTYRKAERKLDDVLAQVRAGVWKPEPPVTREKVGDLTFHEFASRWWAARKAELRPNTQLDYEWRLRKHLLPFFADTPISEIDVDAVDRYREEKVIERERVRRAEASGNPLRDKRGQRRVPLSNESINKTLVMLANILDSAVERGGLETNPARGKRRRLKAPRPNRRVLEPDELTELLAVAGRMDRHLRRDRQIGRRPMIAVMAKAGLRVTELCQLRWRAVDVHHERLIIEQAKTEAGKREVDLTLDVIEELLAWRAERGSVKLDGFVFATASGKPRNKDNVRTVLSRVVERANEERAANGRGSLPPVVPHTLRRTYISLMLEAGAPLHYVMDQVGHEDSKTTLEIYALVQKRDSRPEVKRRFEELLAGSDFGDPGVPAEGREKMSRQTLGSAKSAPVGPPNWPVVHKSGPQTQNQPPEDDLKLPHHTRKAPDFQGFPEWARLGSNQRPLACEASALPLSYAPETGTVYASQLVGMLLTSEAYWSSYGCSARPLVASASTAAGRGPVRLARTRARMRPALPGGARCRKRQQDVAP